MVCGIGSPSRIPNNSRPEVGEAIAVLAPGSPKVTAGEPAPLLKLESKAEAPPPPLVRMKGRREQMDAVEERDLAKDVEARKTFYDRVDDADLLERFRALTRDQALIRLKEHGGRILNSPSVQLHVGGELAGIVEVLRVPEKPGTCEIAYIVSKELQGRGHAKRMVREAEAFAVELGYRRMQALVPPLGRGKCFLGSEGLDFQISGRDGMDQYWSKDLLQKDGKGPSQDSGGRAGGEPKV